MKLNEIIVELMVQDVATSIAFYKNVLGFTEVATEIEHGKTEWAKLTCNGFNISFKDEAKLKREVSYMHNQPIGGSIGICIVVDDVHSLHATFEEKFKTINHPHLTPCGATSFSMRDLDGYVLTFEEF